MCRLTTAVKINACTRRCRPVSASRSSPSWAKSSWHSTPGSPSTTRTVVAPTRNPHRSTANRCSVRYGTTTPRRASSSSIFTIDNGSCFCPSTSAPRTQPRICSSWPSSASHDAPCPFGRAGRTASTTSPDQLIGDRIHTGLPGQPRSLGRLDVPAGGLAVHPRPLGDRPQPVALQPRPQHLTHLNHTDLPESHPRLTSTSTVMTRAVNERTRDLSARRAGWSHDWQPRWSHEAGRKPLNAVPCSWQATAGNPAVTPDRVGGSVDSVRGQHSCRRRLPTVDPSSERGWRWYAAAATSDQNRGASTRRGRRRRFRALSF